MDKVQQKSKFPRQRCVASVRNRLKNKKRNLVRPLKFGRAFSNFRPSCVNRRL